MASKRQVPQLEQPGAGLPLLERYFAGLYLKGVAVFSSKEKTLREFADKAEQAIHIVDTLDEKQAKVPVLIDRPLGVEDSSRAWSAAMTLQHLVIVNLGIAGVIRALCAGDGAKALAEIRIQDVKPSVDAGIEQVERLRQAVDIYSKVIRKCASLATTARHSHPWFGPLDGRGWHALAAIHNGLHCRQLAVIVRQLPRIAV